MRGDRRIRREERDAILRSLRAGVAPRVGRRHLQVGRLDETDAMVADLGRIADGGATMRFVVGEHGSGKTFFLSLVRSIALEKRFVTVHADLDLGRRLHATEGQARRLCAEGIHNLSTRWQPDGGGLTSVVERFVTAARSAARERGVTANVVVQERLESLREMAGGYDFATVVDAYFRGSETGDSVLESNAVRWLRAEFDSKPDARRALGVRTIVDDASFFDHLKRLARLARLAGFSGLLVCLDELVSLYKLSHTQARKASFAQILSMVNDVLQGNARGLGVLLAATPDTVFDTRRGLCSDAALRSRLAESPFTARGNADFEGPVVRLAELAPKDLHLLLSKIRRLHASETSAVAPLDDDGVRAFLKHRFETVGRACLRTPRDTIRAFLDLLAVLEQNPEVSWHELLGHVPREREPRPEIEPLDSDGAESFALAASPAGQDELASFTL